jgi:hypothetical protein
VSAGKHSTSPSIAPATSRSRSCERALIASRTPSAASASAIPRPIPRLAPMTSATLPSIPSSIAATYRGSVGGVIRARRIGGTAVGIALIACLAAPAAMAPAERPKYKPPRIVPLPVASYNSATEVLRFSTMVRRANSVTIIYGKHRQEATQLEVEGGTKKVVKFVWEADFKGQTRKKCYSIRVIAGNRFGTRDRLRKACRLGVQSEDVR